MKVAAGLVPNGNLTNSHDLLEHLMKDFLYAFTWCHKDGENFSALQPTDSPILCKLLVSWCRFCFG